MGRLAYQRGQLSVKQPLLALQVRFLLDLPTMESKSIRRSALFAKQMGLHLWFESTALRLMRTWCNWITRQSTKLKSEGSSPSVLALSPGSSVSSSVWKEKQKVIRSIRIWGTGTLPYSSMAEQAAVNRFVVGSNPTGAAIYWEVGKQAKPSHFECEV